MICTKKTFLALTLLICALVSGCTNGEIGSTYTLTIEKEGNGTVTPVVGEHLLERGVMQTIQAEPAVNWEFARWEGSVPELERESPEIQVVMDEDKTVLAVFQEQAPNYAGQVVIHGEAPGQPVTIYAENLDTGQWISIATDAAGNYSIPPDLCVAGNMLAISVRVGDSFDSSYMWEHGLSTWVFIRGFTVKSGNWILPDLDLFNYGFALLAPYELEQVSIPYLVEIDHYDRDVTDREYFMYFYDGDEFLAYGDSTFTADQFWFDGKLADDTYLNRAAIWYVGVFFSEADYRLGANVWGITTEFVENFQGQEYRTNSCLSNKPGGSLQDERTAQIWADQPGIPEFFEPSNRFNNK